MTFSDIIKILLFFLYYWLIFFGSFLYLEYFRDMYQISVFVIFWNVFSLRVFVFMVLILYCVFWVIFLIFKIKKTFLTTMGEGGG